MDRIPTLSAVFTKGTVVTAANASTINDGVALILMSEEKLLLGLKPLAFIKVMLMLLKNQSGTTSPAKAPKALDKAGMTVADVDFSNSTKLCCRWD
jgi:acetyl-CoA C-acetyltransferase